MFKTIIKVYANRKVAPNSFTLANQLENNTRVLEVDLTSMPSGGYRYLILSKDNKSVAYLLSNDSINITSAMTWEAGTYKANIVITSTEIIDKVTDVPTQFVSDTFTVYVQDTPINQDSLSQQPLPIELKTVYDELLALKTQIEHNLTSGAFVGDSAYEEAVKNGFVGTEREWLASLKGEKGDKGDPYTTSIEFNNLAAQVRQDSAAVRSDKVHVDNVVAQFDTKVSQVNATIDGKIKQASDSAIASATSASKALQSEVNAKASEQNASTSATQAQASATNAKTSEDNALKSAQSVSASIAQIQKNADDIALLKADKTEIELLDKTTNKKHKLYILNGKLMMEEVI